MSLPERGRHIEPDLPAYRWVLLVGAVVGVFTVFSLWLFALLLVGVGQ